VAILKWEKPDVYLPKKSNPVRGVKKSITENTTNTCVFSIIKKLGL
jgi:hypothetical protein